MIINVCIKKTLENRGRSFYWLSKQTGISHTTFWRLKKGKALGINFVTLEKICQALECEPGDVLKLENGKKKERTGSQKSRKNRDQKAS
jgi:putative transcriptional regulator